MARTRTSAKAGTPLELDPKIENAHVRFLRDWAKLMGRIQTKGYPALRKAIVSAQRKEGTLRGDAEGDQLKIPEIDRLLNAMVEEYGQELIARSDPSERRAIGIEVNIEADTGKSWVQNIETIVEDTPGLAPIERTLLTNFIVAEEPTIPRPVRRGWVRVQLDMIKQKTKVRFGPKKGTIESIPTRSMQRMGSIIRQGIARGTRVESIMGQLAELKGITERRAETIARDQALTHSSRMNRIRHEAVKITHYFWQNVGDQRVRPLHRNGRGGHGGQRFAYARPPKDGNPGEPIQCRCWASPDLSSALREVKKLSRAQQLALLDSASFR